MKFNKTFPIIRFIQIKAYRNCKYIKEKNKNVIFILGKNKDNYQKIKKKWKKNIFK